MKAMLRRLIVLLLRPLAVALDPRFRQTEDLLVRRMDRVESHVGTDAEVATELTSTQGRRLAAIEDRLRRIEEHLEALQGANAGR